MSDARPVLFVTNHAPAFRVAAFKLLAEREDVRFALVGGTLRHGGGGTDAAGIAGLPARMVGERAVYRLAASGRFRAVIAGLSGRIALPAAYLGARRARVPFVLWATIWAHPRTPVHALSYLPLRHLYRDADAVVTYGRHVTRYVRSKGARGPVFEAPQAVDDAFWSVDTEAEADRRAPYQVVFAGRIEREKGIDVLLEGWRRSGLSEPGAALVLAGSGELGDEPPPGVIVTGKRSPVQLRNLYAGSDVLVLPSIAARDFLEPWGLVVNEGMNQRLPVIASEAVGAVAGGLVEHDVTGLVVPPGDSSALAEALGRFHDEPQLRRRLGEAAREAVRPYTFEAWAAGMSRALTAAGAGSGSDPGC